MIAPSSPATIGLKGGKAGAKPAAWRPVGRVDLRMERRSAKFAAGGVNVSPAQRGEKLGLERACRVNGGSGAGVAARTLRSDRRTRRSLPSLVPPSPHVRRPTLSPALTLAAAPAAVAGARHVTPSGSRSRTASGRRRRAARRGRPRRRHCASVALRGGARRGHRGALGPGTRIGFRPPRSSPPAEPAADAAGAATPATATVGPSELAAEVRSPPAPVSATLYQVLQAVVSAQLDATVGAVTLTPPSLPTETSPGLAPAASAAGQDVTIALRWPNRSTLRRPVVGVCGRAGPPPLGPAPTLPP
jgi:hypothetical protein